MTDCVVTVPKNFTHPCAPGLKGLAAWVNEGDPAGAPWSGLDWEFSTWGPRPDCQPGDRLYIVCEGRLRGYAPIVRVRFSPVRGEVGYVSFIRRGDAVAVTIDEHIQGFRGWRKRWWDRANERPFPEWKESGTPTLFQGVQA